MPAVAVAAQLDRALAATLDVAGRAQQRAATTLFDVEVGWLADPQVWAEKPAAFRPAARVVKRDSGERLGRHGEGDEPEQVEDRSRFHRRQAIPTRWYRRPTVSELPENLQAAPLSEVDPEIAGVLEGELQRQRGTLEMIASENFVPQAVLEA